MKHPNSVSENQDEMGDKAEATLKRVEKRAYELYESRGKEAGHELDDWLQAEAEAQLEEDRVA